VTTQILLGLWTANRKVDGAHKLWRAARRSGHDVGRDQVARLMREMDIEGTSRRRKKVFTTVSAPDATRAPDLVNRNFTAERPDALWVTDITYVPTRSGMASVCFIVDAFSRRIVGWRVASNMRTDMVLDALEMARRSRGGRRLVGLVTHADAGSQFTSVRFTALLDEIGARPSIGTVADSFDNALAEMTKGLYKTECVFGPDAPGHWDDVDELELATCRGSTGSTATGCTATSTTCLPPSSRSSVLPRPTDRPHRGWNPIARASIRPRSQNRMAWAEGYMNRPRHRPVHVVATSISGESDGKSSGNTSTCMAPDITATRNSDTDMSKTSQLWPRASLTATIQLSGSDDVESTQ